MARKATVDVDKAMQMLREGRSTQAVAEYFGVSRQAIDLHRHKFIESGRLDNKRAPRSGATPVLQGSGEAGSKNSPPVPLDRLIELTIEAFDSLKKVAQLEAELAKYKQDYQKATERIEQLEKEVSKRREQEARWQLAMPPQDIVRPSSKDNQ